MNNPIIEFRNIDFSYENSDLQLKNINLLINTNEKVGIIGANGAGKSTLLKLLLGLLKPTRGDILFNNQSVTKKNISFLRKQIGYAFQDPDNQLFMPTVKDDIAFSFKQNNKTDDECEKVVDRVLTDLNVQYLKNKSPHKLSGGEKRLASLAVALSTNPAVLVLDEPTVGLDPKSRRNIIDLLQDRDETLLITTHDMDMAYEVCNRIIIFFNGELKADDTQDIIFNNNDLLKSNHLEMPLQLLYSN